LCTLNRQVYSPFSWNLQLVPPDWFKSAIDQKPDGGFFESEGTRCHFLHWPNPGRQALLLIHGHGAHAHWWDFVAPSFTECFDVVAVDLSGCGDSEHRQEYSAAAFASELIDCCRHTGLVNPVLVGHSFGGAIARTAAYLHQDIFGGLVLVDSLVPARKGARQPPPMPRTKTRYYPTLAEGLRRFRLRPPQPCANDYLVSHIASHSLKETADGYCFKLDPAIFAKMSGDDSLPAGSDMIRALSIPVGCIYGEESRFFPPDAIEAMQDLVGKSRVTGIQGAHHHVFLDQPQAFCRVLSALLSDMLPAME
jgi:pimeloyl-ACP methyl ester carboxylesterase